MIENKKNSFNIPIRYFILWIRKYLAENEDGKLKKYKVTYLCCFEFSRSEFPHLGILKQKSTVYNP